MTFNRDENKIRAEVERTFVGNLRVGLGFGTFSDGDRKHTRYITLTPFPGFMEQLFILRRKGFFFGGGVTC